MVAERKEKYVILRKEPMNDKPFTHYARNGTKFSAKRCDFVGGVEATVPPNDLTVNEQMADVAEMIGYHAVSVYPNLNGFAGYDCINFRIVRWQSDAKKRDR